MKLKNVLLAFKDQMPLKRFIRNFFITGNALGLFSIRSHAREDGTPKVKYNTKATALKAAESMSKKKGVHFSAYKCMHCDGYHLGKNRDNKYKPETNEQDTC